MFLIVQNLNSSCMQKIQNQIVPVLVGWTTCFYLLEYSIWKHCLQFVWFIIMTDHMPLWFNDLDGRYEQFIGYSDFPLVQVNGSLSYFDRIQDGFYIVNGMDPYAWTISADQGRMPSFDSLKAIDPHDDLSITVVLIDQLRDPILKELQNWVLNISSSWVSTKDVIDQLACLVCNQMGYVLSTLHLF